MSFEALLKLCACIIHGKKSRAFPIINTRTMIGDYFCSCFNVINNHRSSDTESLNWWTWTDQMIFCRTKTNRIFKIKVFFLFTQPHNCCTKLKDSITILIKEQHSHIGWVETTENGDKNMDKLFCNNRKIFFFLWTVARNTTICCVLNVSRRLESLN